MDKTIRVALVDDDPKCRAEVGLLLKRAGARFKLVGFFERPEAAMREIPALKPDVILMDILFPEALGVECVRKLSPLLPETGILMLTVSSDASHIFDALCAGAHGYLIKRDLPERLISSIENIQNGHSPLSPSVARKIVDYFRLKGENPDVLDALTPREAAVIRAISHGSSNKEVADQLDIKAATVQVHLRSIYEKLHVHSRREAVQKLRSPPSR